MRLNVQQHVQQVDKMQIYSIYMRFAYYQRDQAAGMVRIKFANNGKKLIECANQWIMYKQYKHTRKEKNSEINCACVRE